MVISIKEIHIINISTNFNLGAKLMNRNKLKRQSGFTLMEMAIVVIVGVILLGASASVYIQTIKIHKRQEKVMLIERSLQEINEGIERQIFLAGQGLAVTLPEAFSAPNLPGVGSTLNPRTNKFEPIPLGVINPFKINNYDAFTIFYADPTFPRMYVSENTIANLDIGSAKIAVGTLSNVISPTGGGKGGNDDNDGYNREASRFPTPTETPINGDPRSGGSNNNNNFSTGLPAVANAQMFQEGDLFLLIGTGSGQSRYNFASPTKASSRLVRITSVGSLGTRQFNQGFLTVNYNLCISGECGPQLPGLTNNEIAPTSFGAGSILVPLRAISFYVKQTEKSKYLVKNTGGLILPSDNDSTNGVVRGGEEIFLGEIDGFEISYNLVDGSTNKTPANLPISWVNSVQSLDITLTRGVPQTNGENLTQVVKSNFPILLNNFN